MEIKPAVILEGDEPLSKALASVLDGNTAVIITKKGKYTGVVEDRNLRLIGDNPAKVKCETIAIRPPVISPKSGLLERTEAFLLGKFKALPVVDENQKPLGIITRVEVLKELLSLGAIPEINVTNIMSSPVYTIEEKSKIGEAKRKMKEYETKKLMVTRNGKPVGVFSSLDFAAFAIKPKEATYMKRGVVTMKSIDDEEISRFYRPDITMIPEDNSVKKAAQTMVEKQISHVIVVSKKDGKPIGVLSAVDIFKWIKEKSEEKIEIEISGHDEETRGLHNDIKNTVGKAAEKFRESYGITKINLHVKSTKSFYSVRLTVDGKERFVMTADGPTLEDAVNIVAAELKKVLGRKKSIEKSRKVRAKGGMSE